MRFRNTSIYLSHILIIGILFTSCSSQKQVDLNAKSNIYKQAVTDGCMTAEGNYTKNHKVFINNVDYHEGWFFGRHYCEYDKRENLKM